MSPPIVPAGPPTPEEEAIVTAAAAYWRTAANEAPVEAIKRLEDAAKQLVTLTSSLQGLYLAAFAFSDLAKRLPHPLLRLACLVPVVLWVVSLLYASRVFVPQARLQAGVSLDDPHPAAWLALREAHFAIRDEKLRLLTLAHRILMASFIVLLVLLGLVLTLLPAAQGGPTEIVILTPSATAVPKP